MAGVGCGRPLWLCVCVCCVSPGVICLPSMSTVSISVVVPDRYRLMRGRRREIGENAPVCLYDEAIRVHRHREGVLCLLSSSFDKPDETKDGWHRMEVKMQQRSQRAKDHDNPKEKRKEQEKEQRDHG